jgi:hypothetical protein
VLIEDLIRLGRPLLDGDMKPDEVLRLITDVSDDRVKNFYRNVFVVVLPADGGEPVALPRQQFGNEVRRNKRDDFDVDANRSLGVPITLPSGGNPLNPQGRYGLPVYPLYDPHVQAFRDSAKGVEQFLDGRLERTENFALDDASRQQVARAIHELVAATDLDPKKNLGVLVLARCEPGGFFRLAANQSKGHVGVVGGSAIVPNYGRILAAIWEAKVAEGRSAGVRPGPCSIDGTGAEAVSAYCKAWPWAFPTWTCPLPDGGDEAKLVEGIGLSSASYRALTLGASVFNQLARPVDKIVVAKELFSPTENRPGKEQSQRRNLNDLPTIVGSAYLLPIEDHALNDDDNRIDFIRGVRRMLSFDPKMPNQTGRYLASIVGFDAFLPPELDRAERDRFRLTLTYFSGDYTRGDVKLRAMIQDVLPSKLGVLCEIAKEEATMSMSFLRQLMPYMSEKQNGYYVARYDSVPWLLARAYGGTYLWSQLETLLHGRMLRAGRVTANLARRLETLVPTWPKSNFAIFEEVAFYVNIVRFLGRANRDLAGRSEEDCMPLRHWKELLAAVDEGPVEEILTGEPSAAELGFACGVVIRRFSRVYYMGMKEGGKSNPDYLRDRVLNFGSSLRPHQVIDIGLAKIRELPLLHKDIKVSQKLEPRVGAVINACQRSRRTVTDGKDEFMTGFWSGYCVQGYDRLAKPETPSDMNHPTTDKE